MKEFEDPSSARLQRAIAATRGAHGEWALSEGTRANIAEALAAAGAAAPRRWVAPFVPLPRLALTAALPVVAGLLLLSFGTRVPQVLSAQAAVVSAVKDGAEVRFTLGEAGTGHRVYRSSTPQGLETDQRVAVRRGSFRDRLDDEASIVFYRVE